jgi:hypothetical protein
MPASVELCQQYFVEVKDRLELPIAFRVELRRRHQIGTSIGS